MTQGKLKLNKNNVNKKQKVVKPVIAKKKTDNRSDAQKVRDRMVEKMTKNINKNNEAIIAAKYVGSGGHFSVVKPAKVRNAQPFKKKK